MQRIAIFTLAFILLCNTGWSQFQFVEKGRIVFQRKVNLYGVLPDILAEAGIVPIAEIPSYIQRFRSLKSQFGTDSFQLVFDGQRTFYEPMGKVSDYEFQGDYLIRSGSKNRVWVDLFKAQYFAEKNAGNEFLLVKDTITRIKWKLTNEIREIAGYTCRRANALIMDSVYIVAFFTDAIKTKGGPESITGLPGMILGVALPQQHISYFASRVESYSATADQLEPSKKDFDAKGSGRSQYQQRIVAFLKTWRNNSGWTRIFVNL